MLADRLLGGLTRHLDSRNCSRSGPILFRQSELRQRTTQALASRYVQSCRASVLHPNVRVSLIILNGNWKGRWVVSAAKGIVTGPNCSRLPLINCFQANGRLFHP
jgi:hypothetical protein